MGSRELELNEWGGKKGKWHVNFKDIYRVEIIFGDLLDVNF